MWPSGMVKWPGLRLFASAEAITEEGLAAWGLSVSSSYFWGDGAFLSEGNLGSTLVSTTVSHGLPCGLAGKEVIKCLSFNSICYCEKGHLSYFKETLKVPSCLLLFSCTAVLFEFALLYCVRHHSGCLAYLISINFHDNLVSLHHFQQVTRGNWCQNGEYKHFTLQI